jgi:hypothetical protein
MLFSKMTVAFSCEAMSRGVNASPETDMQQSMV